MGSMAPEASAVPNISAMLTFLCWLWRKEEMCEHENCKEEFVCDSSSTWSLALEMWKSFSDAHRIVQSKPHSPFPAQPGFSAHSASAHTSLKLISSRAFASFRITATKLSLYLPVCVHFFAVFASPPTLPFLFSEANSSSWARSPAPGF